jgi:hypothetical protein
MTILRSRERSTTDRWLHAAIALLVTAAYGWDAWIGINAYRDYALGSLTGIVWDVAVIALSIFLVRGWIFAQLTIAVVALVGLQGRWSMLTSVWFWMPNMNGRRTLVLMTTAANVMTLVLLSVPLVWYYSNRALAGAARRVA